MIPSDVPPVALQVISGCLIATLQSGIDGRGLERFRHDLLQRLRASEGRSVAIDLSSVDLLDALEFSSLRQTVDMCALMGTRVVLVGIRPGVAASLVELPVDITGLETALSVEAATRMLAADSTDASPAVRASSHEP